MQTLVLRSLVIDLCRNFFLTTVCVQYLDSSSTHSKELNRDEGASFKGGNIEAEEEEMEEQLDYYSPIRTFLRFVLPFLLTDSCLVKSCALQIS